MVMVIPFPTLAKTRLAFACVAERGVWLLAIEAHSSSDFISGGLGLWLHCAVASWFHQGGNDGRLPVTYRVCL